MSSHDDDDLAPSETPGYKITGEVKSPEEYAKMDANDESLNRWKASLGLDAAATAPASGPKLTLLALELVSPSLPPGKPIVLDVTDPETLIRAKKEPITIKEGVEYKLSSSHSFHGMPSLFTRVKRIDSVQGEPLHCIGVRYIQAVKRAGITVDKLEQMIGSYGANEKPYVKNFPTEESPSGLVARSGTYHVRSRLLDDDKVIYADFDWCFKLAKEW